MKIVHLVNEFSNVGNGIVNVCCDLACKQAQLGHDVTVLSREGDFIHILEENGGNFKILNQERNLNNLVKMFYQFDKYLKELNPDVVNCHMMTGLILAKIFQKKYKYKIVSTVHNIYQKSSFLMKYSDAIVCLSVAIKKHFILQGVAESKLFIIENGVIGSPRRLSKNDIKPYYLEKPAIVSIGAVCPRKGTDILIKALAGVHEKGVKAHLYLIGNIDWLELKDDTYNSPLKNFVHFQGLDKQPQKYLLEADLYVLASRRETFPLSLLEAKEYGLPIISSNIDGCPDALDYGESGVLFESENYNDLADKINMLLIDEEKKLLMREKSVQTAIKFTIDNMVEKYLKLYQIIIHGNIK